MAISFHFNTTPKAQFLRGKLRNAVERLISDRKSLCGDIAIVFVSDEELLNMNKEYLEHDYYTDIITFDYSEEGVTAGDLFISIDRLRENAKTFKVPLENEIRRIVGHGVLHLLGQNDKTTEEKEKMTLEEELFLNFFK